LISAHGRAYLEQGFPKLDSVKTASIVSRIRNQPQLNNVAVDPAFRRFRKNHNDVIPFNLKNMAFMRFEKGKPSPRMDLARSKARARKFGQEETGL